jgi:hypothetical protein
MGIRGIPDPSIGQPFAISPVKYASCHLPRYGSLSSVTVNRSEGTLDEQYKKTHESGSTPSRLLGAFTERLGTRLTHLFLLTSHPSPTRTTYSVGLPCLFVPLVHLRQGFVCIFYNQKSRSHDRSQPLCRVQLLP